MRKVFILMFLLVSITAATSEQCFYSEPCKCWACWSPPKIPPMRFAQTEVVPHA